MLCIERELSTVGCGAITQAIKNQGEMYLKQSSLQTASALNTVGKTSAKIWQIILSVED